MLDHAYEGIIQPLREKESDLHANAVQRLARELGLPVDVVQRTYGEVLEKLKEEARIRAFLPIFVSRHVKEHFRQCRRE
jgi:uncharacterized protein (DUF2126 family)